MSVSVSFYTTNSDPRSINKTLNLVGSLSCDIKDNTSIVNPAMLVNLPATYKNVNYMYIPDFNRYYFCKVDVISGALCQIYGECDVLMSFKTGILKTKILLDRTANGKYSNLYLSDEKIRKYAYERTQAKLFPNDVLNRDGYCVLITAGGAPSNS